MSKKVTNTPLKYNWKVIALIIMAVTVFATLPISGILKKPEKNAVKIGVILPSDEQFNFEWPIRFAEAQINNFCETLRKDIVFEFVVESTPDWDPTVHQEYIEQFDTMDIDLIIGGFSSGQAQASLEYIKENDMLLISPSSTAPALEMEDNLFRLAPNDAYEANAIAEMLWSWGIDAVIVLTEDSPHVHDIYHSFEAIYPIPIHYSENIIGLIQNHLDSLETSVGVLIADGYEIDRIGALYLGSGAQEVADIVLHEEVDGTGVPRYQNLQSILWFSNNWNAKSEPLLEVSDVESLRFFSTLYAPFPRTGKWDWLSNMYTEDTGKEFNFYIANCYDAAWIYAKAVIEASKDKTEFIKPILRPTANQYFGASGWCHLNMAGDRRPLDYDIWGIGEGGDGVEWIRYGWYESYSDEVTWYTHLGIDPLSSIRRITLFEDEITISEDETTFLVHGWVTGPDPMGVYDLPYWSDMTGPQQIEFLSYANFELEMEDGMGGGPDPVTLRGFGWLVATPEGDNVYVVRYVVFHPNTFDSTKSPYTLNGHWSLRFTPVGEDPIEITYDDSITVNVLPVP